MAAREEWIGWSDDERTRNLQLIVNHSRFLIPPWVRVKGLASKILGRCARQLPADWEKLYGYRPLLLETLVDAERFRGAGVARAGGRGEPAVSVNLNLCESCLEKQRTIDRLKQEIQSLPEKVHRLERGVRDSASHGRPVPGRDGETDRGLSPGCGAACR